MIGDVRAVSCEDTTGMALVGIVGLRAKHKEDGGASEDNYEGKTNDEAYKSCLRAPDFGDPT